MTNDDSENANPYSPPTWIDESQASNGRIDPSLPLQVQLMMSALLYRRFEFSGWVNLTLEWDAVRLGNIAMTVNQQRFDVKRPWIYGKSIVELEIGEEPLNSLLVIEAQHAWYSVQAFQISIADIPVYQEGDFQRLKH